METRVTLETKVSKDLMVCQETQVPKALKDSPASGDQLVTPESLVLRDSTEPQDPRDLLVLPEKLVPWATLDLSDHL